MPKKNNVALIILDGYGCRSEKKGNAISVAKKPNIDLLFKSYPNIQIAASGEAVGLPVGQMGNSEVGHLNIGAGRIIYTGLSIVDKKITDQEFAKNQAFNKAFNHVKKNHSRLHIIGLFSDGGVHSSLSHILEMIKVCENNKIPTVIHPFTDGRDSLPNSFLTQYWPILKKFLAKAKYIKLGVICSRYYAMDRDQNWERSIKAYNALLGIDQVPSFHSDPSSIISEQFKNKIKSDEFILPIINDAYPTKQLIINDNDAIINMNFRPDRARQISHLLYKSTYYKFQPTIRRKNLCYVTLMNYEGITPTMVAYPPIAYKNVLGEVISKNHLSQLRISETEKYAHVTFFFDGGKEINYPNEKKIIVPSPKVATYDLQPQMSCDELTKKILSSLGKFNLIIANYPNCDMVGHTANMDATIKAVEAIDRAIGQIYKKAIETNTTLFIIADHGNAETLIDKNNKPMTAHTTNPVPFLVTDKNVKLAKTGKLANVAPSILKYLQIKQPKEMDESSLIL